MQGIISTSNRVLKSNGDNWNNLSTIKMTEAPSPLSVVLTVVVGVWTGNTVATVWSSLCLLVICISSLFIFEHYDDVCELSNVMDISYNVSQCGIIITDLS